MKSFRRNSSLTPLKTQLKSANYSYRKLPRGDKIKNFTWSCLAVLQAQWKNVLVMTLLHTQSLVNREEFFCLLLEITVTSLENISSNL